MLPGAFRGLAAPGDVRRGHAEHRVEAGVARVGPRGSRASLPSKLRRLATLCGRETGGETGGVATRPGRRVASGLRQRGVAKTRDDGLRQRRATIQVDVLQ